MCLHICHGDVMLEFQFILTRLYLHQIYSTQGLFSLNQEPQARAFEQSASSLKQSRSDGDTGMLE
jgi:hypothetical protein